MNNRITAPSIVLISAAIFLSACSGADNGVVPVTVADETTGVIVVKESSTEQEAVTDSADHVEIVTDDTSVQATPEEYTEYTTTEPVKPCTYAHEMLHCFGAYDLYYSNSDIPQEYVDHLAEIGSEDIMYMVYDSEEIHNELGEPDAYYVGLCDTCDEVEEWGLPLADRFD